MARRVSISAAEARRIALAAQGFDRERPGVANDVRHFRRAMAAITVLQLDFVNVLMPAHFLMIWSRLGAYDRQRFENYLYHSGEHTEQWAHEASIVSCEDWPLLAHRRDDHRPWKNSPLTSMKNSETYLSEVLETVSKQGALTAHDLPQVDGPKRNAGDWHRPVARWGLEYHFGKGNLAVRKRLRNFQRVYDLPERIIDSRICSIDVNRDDAERELVRKSARSLGVASVHDIADYYRMTAARTLPRLQELIEEGAIQEVAVEGWTDVGYLSKGAKAPRSIPGASLLSPFDPVVWFRPRAKRLYDFDYRIEIYVPEAKRRWGYYVLPFRVGDAINARVDLKADRKASTLRVQNAHLEGGADMGATARALTSELRSIAEWLQLENVHTKKTNAFEKALARLL